MTKEELRAHTFETDYNGIKAVARIETVLWLLRTEFDLTVHIRS